MKIGVVRYGAMANKHFVLFNQSIAEAITANGRVINQFCSMKLIEYLESQGAKNTLIANDTDSAYFTLDAIIPKNLSKEEKIDWCDNYCKNELQEVINNALEEISDLLNAYDSKVQEFEREVIADTGFWVAKKRYAIRVFDQEGVRLKEPKMKIMGLDIVRSNTPDYCKKTLKQSVELILDKDEHEIQEYIKNVKVEFHNQPIEMISRVTGISKLNYTLSDKSIPINSRAAIVHNTLIDSLNLSNEYEHISTSDKIKYVFLKTPNPAFNQNVIGFVNPDFLTEAGLSDYIDRDEMFSKFFFTPMNNMLVPLNWSPEKQQDFSEWDF